MSPSALARLAGLLYLALFAFGVFAEFGARMQLIVPGDAVATAAHILAQEGLFRLGFLADLAAGFSFFLLAAALHALLKKSGGTAAILFLFLVAISAAITCLNLLNQFAALLLLKGKLLPAFRPDQVQALALFFLDMHKHGYLISQVFFGAWLFPLGYLVLRERIMPGLFGYLLWAGGAGHLLDVLLQFLFPGLATTGSPLVMLASLLGEPPFFLWLLIKGVRSPIPGKVEALRGSPA